MISMDKQYRCDGREVRIYAVDGEGPFSIHGAVKQYFGWVTTQWRANGEYFSEGTSPFDLIEVKPEHTRWCIVSEHLDYATQEEAQAAAVAFTTHGCPVAVVPVTFREGDGL